MPSLPSSPIALLRDELSSIVRGPVYLPTDTPEFLERTRTWNGKVKSPAKLVVSPLDAEDAGGYGIGGWSVAGDIILDMSLIRQLDIEPPVSADDGVPQWTRLRDMPAVGSKGKARVAHANTLSRPETAHKPSAKRRRDDDDDQVPSSDAAGSAPDYAPSGDDVSLRNHDNASRQVAEFLRGPPLAPEDGEAAREPPRNRRRLLSPQPDGDSLSTFHLSTLDHGQLSRGSGDSSGASASKSGTSSVETHTGATTPVETTPPLEGDSSTLVDTSLPTTRVQNSSPFGYMDSAATTSPPLARHSGSNSSPFGYLSASSTSAAAGGLFSNWQPPSHGTTGFSRDMQAASSSRTGPLPPNWPPGPSYSSSEGGFTVPQHQLGGIAPARPIHTHAYVTLGAGMRQKEVDIYTAEHLLEGYSGVTGLREDGIVPYHVPTSAHPVGSSIMLLAGFGFLGRLHGLSIDNLVEVEMVLADGSIVIVSAEEHPELWWAIRGAGTAFGIATRYKVKAFPVPVVFAGNLIYRFHRSTAPSLIKHFRDCIKGAPRELYANVLLTAGPADKDSLVVIQMCYLGPKEKGIEYLQAISSWEGERCLLNEVNEKSFLNQQDSVAQVLRGKAGNQWFLRSSLIHSLPDEVIHKTVVQFANTPLGCTWIFELAGGAIADFEDTALPKEQREATWTVAALHQWEMNIDDPRCITSAEQWMQNTIRPVSIGGPYPTFLGRHEPPSRVMACYGKCWPRLAELKRKYDPNGLFKNNFWPLDQAGEPVEALYNEPPSP